MWLSRMAHPLTCKGTLSHIWGYITDWTNCIRDWFIHEWRHLLALNVQYASQHCHTWAEKVGRKIGLHDPRNNRCIAFIDGGIQVRVPSFVPFP